MREEPLWVSLCHSASIMAIRCLSMNKQGPKMIKYYIRNVIKKFHSLCYLQSIYCNDKTRG